MQVLVNKIFRQSGIGEIYNLDLELRKIGLLRILLGLVFFVRQAEILHTLIILDENPNTILYSQMFLFVIIAFTLGFVSPLSTLILLLFSTKMDSLQGTFTLGTAILEITMLPLFLINSGQFYSIDRFIITKRIKVLEWYTNLYRIIGARNKSDIKDAYTLGFLAYAIISFGALSLHINDEYWINGVTTKSLLLNSYLSKEFQFFRFFNETYPVAFEFISVIASIFQSVFQFLMIPLIFTRFGQYFVKYWGFLFFLISLFFINLSYLPHVEIILWILIFSPIKEPIKNIAIFYDDHCNLCKRTMKFFKVINYNNRLELLAASSNKELLAKHNITLSDAKIYMTGLKNGRVISGIDLYYEIIKVNLLLWPLFPVMLIAKYSGIGGIVYNYIAQRRYRIFGFCELSFQDQIAQRPIPIQKSNNAFLTKSFFTFYLFLIIAYPFLRIPSVNKALNIPSDLTYFSNIIFLYIGFDLPNVFNVVDLSMGDNWVELYRVQNNEHILVPLVGRNGERLSYLGCDLLNFSNHNSDLLYFGTTLQLRRKLIFQREMEFFKKDTFVEKNFLRRIQYDYKWNELNSKAQYLIKVFRKPSNDFLHVPVNDRHKELIYEEVINFDGKEMKRFIES